MGKYNYTLVAVLTVSLLAGGNAVYWPCESNADCSATGSTCSLELGQCECNDFESVFSGDFTKCLKTSLFGDTCEDSVQCNLMPSGANCKSGVCDCADEQNYVRGRCRPLSGLYQSCETDLDCHFGYDRQSVECRELTCVCANGYYHRNGNICRRKSMEINDACVVDADCIELGANVQCRSLKCQYIDEIKSNSSSKTIYHAAGSSSSSKTITTTKTAKSPSTEPLSQLSKSSTKSEESKDTLALVNGRLTDTETDITTDPERQQQQQQQQRLREIAVQTSLDAFELKPLQTPQQKNVGTATTSTSTSSRRLSYYRRRASAFRFDDEDKTFSTLSNTDDDGDDRKFGSSCTENGKSCSGLPHSVCSNNLCFCKQGYYQKSGKCFAELGEIAESADECEHTFDDISKKCICQKNYFYERSLRACRKPIQYHLSCTSNSQCSPFGAAYCHSEIPRRCTCEEYAEYDAMQQMCVYKQGLGSQCENSDGCPVNHSICSNRYCVCKEGFFEREDTCLAGVGADCITDAECIAENSICEVPSTPSDDRRCQCRKGYVHFKDECLKEAEEIEDECIDTEQCKPLLGTCIEKKCSCTPEQHFKFGRCEDKKAVGEPCARAGECFVEKEPENVECRNSVCQCKFGLQHDDGHKACIRVMPNKKNSSGRPSALKIITFLLIGAAFLITSAAIKQAYYT